MSRVSAWKSSGMNCLRASEHSVGALRNRRGAESGPDTGTKTSEIREETGSRWRSLDPGPGGTHVLHLLQCDECCDDRSSWRSIYPLFRVAQFNLIPRFLKVKAKLLVLQKQFSDKLLKARNVFAGSREWSLRSRHAL